MAGDFDFKDVLTSGDEKAEAEAVEIAVVMVGHDARFVFGRGAFIESDIEAGLNTDEIGPAPIAPAEKGLWIWEGTPGWRSGINYEGVDEGGDPIYEGHGNWRRPTAEEASRIVSGDFDLFGPPRLLGESEVPS